MPLTLWFFGLAVLALLGLAADVPALRPGDASRRLAFVSIALKALVALGFGGWWLAFRVIGVRGNGWSDLATLVSLLLLSVPLLALTIIIDAVIVARRRRRA